MSCDHERERKQGLVFTLDAPGVYGALYEHREDESEVDRRLAYWLQSFREGNQPTIDRMTSMFRVAAIALIAETALLAVGLAVS